MLADRKELNDQTKILEDIAVTLSIEDEEDESTIHN